MNFLDDVYPSTFEGIFNDTYEYRFISSVNGNDITKIVTISPLEHEQFGEDLWWNLAFGNLEEDENGVPFVNDSSETNNNDFDKVLGTVFACSLMFLQRKPQARICFFGNTEHKHLLYKRKISAKLPQLTEYFNVIGGKAEYNVEFVEKEQNIKRKGSVVTRKVRVKDSNSFSFSRLTHLEKYNVSSTKDYDFVTLNLKES